MDTISANPRFAARLEKFSRLNSFIVVAIAIPVFIGWLFQIEIFKSILPGLPTMKFNTAISLGLTGVALLLIPKYPLLSRSLAAFVFLMGVLTLSQYLFDWNLGIDELFIKDTNGTYIPGRMASVSAFIVSLMGAALFSLSFGKNTLLVQVLALIIIGLSAIVLLGYIYGVEELYRSLWFSSVALHTAIAFMMLGLSILFAYPGTSLLRILTYNSAGAYVARRILPLTLLIPIAAGWLIWQGKIAGLYNTDFGLVIFTLSNIFILTVTNLKIAYTLHYIDAQRKMATDALRASYLELEKKVHERTHELIRINDVLQEEVSQRTRAETQFRALMDFAPNGMLLVNAAGQIILVNRQLEKDFGYSRNEVIGQKIEILIPEALRSRHEQHRRHYSGEPHVREMGIGLELFAQRKDGTQFPVEVSLAPININGETWILSSIRDATERRQYERSLLFNASLQENVSDAVIATDLDFHIQSWNRAAEKIYGWSAAEVMGKSVTDILKTRFESDEEFQQVRREFLNTGSWHSEFVQHDKENRELFILGSTTLFKDKSGTPIGIVSVNRDITERRRIEEEARRLQTVLNNMLEGAQIIGYDWRYIYLNKAAAEQGRQNRDELLGKTMMEAYPDIDKTALFATLQRCMTERQSAHIENQFTFADKSTSWFELSIQPSAEGIFILSTNIDERKSLEAELHKRNEQLQDSNDEIQRFAYIVSHDLRAPLINLKGFSQLLRDALAEIDGLSTVMQKTLDSEQYQIWKTATEDKIPSALEFINHAVERMDYFTSAILRLSRMGHRQLNYEIIQVNDLIDAILQSLSNQIDKAKIEITVEPLPLVHADRFALDQIFSNLISNAIKFLSPKREGKIHIFGEQRPLHTIFHVKDNGRGILKNHYDKIFAPFRRGITDVEGEGMGLAYVQSLVRRHGGNIWFESKPDEGTTFSFTIQNQKENDDGLAENNQASARRR